MMRIRVVHVKESNSKNYLVFFAGFQVIMKNTGQIIILRMK